MQKYNLVAENPESTVVSDYQVEYRTEKEYQSEAELERVFIKLLTEQAYEYLPIHTEAELSPTCAGSWKNSTATPLLTGSGRGSSRVV